MFAKAPIPADALVAFARKWQIQELSLFGSILREDFGPESDVDVLVVFSPGVNHALESWLDMVDELEAIFSRRVDLVERKLIENPFRRHHILTHRQVVYAA